MSDLRSPLPSRLNAALIWIALSAVFTVSSAATYTVKGETEPLLWVWWWAGAEWLIYGLLSPVVFRLAERVPLTRERWAAALPALAAGWLAFHVAVQLVYLGIQEFLPPAMFDWTEPSFGTLLPIYLTKRAGVTMIVFAGMVIVAHLAALYRRVLERERRAAELESALTRSQLEVLKGQLQPHFLFNTLNTIASLVHDDPDGAERVLTRLGDLLRMSLQEEGNGEVPLARELAFLERYVEIQRIRFADRLTVTIDAPEALGRALVPSLLLQPLVENAIRHGIEPRAEGGTVTVAAAREGDRLVLTVRDDGVGIDPSRPDARETNGHGVGLRNTRARLARLHGEGGHRFAVGPLAGGGTEVRIELPWRVVDDD